MAHWRWLELGPELTAFFHSLILCGKFSASFIFGHTCPRELLLLSFQLVRMDQELFLHGSCRMSCNIQCILKCFPKGCDLCKNELSTIWCWTQMHSLQKPQETNTRYSHFSKSNVPGGNFSHMLAILYFAGAGPGETQTELMPCVVCFHIEQTLLRFRKIVIYPDKLAKGSWLTKCHEKKGFQHCDTLESLELVGAWFPTLFLEGLGNHQILHLARVEAATCILQVLPSSPCRWRWPVLVPYLQGQMGQTFQQSSIPALGESKTMAMLFNFRFYQDLEEDQTCGRILFRIGLSKDTTLLWILLNIWYYCCFEARPRKCWLCYPPGKEQHMKCWFGSYLKHSLKLNKRHSLYLPIPLPFPLPVWSTLQWQGKMDNVHGCGQGWTLLCKL